MHGSRAASRNPGPVGRGLHRFASIRVKSGSRGTPRALLMQARRSAWSARARLCAAQPSRSAIKTREISGLLPRRGLFRTASAF